MRLCSAFSAGLGITLAFQIGCGGSTDGPGGGSPTSSASTGPAATICKAPSNPAVFELGAGDVDSNSACSDDASRGMSGDSPCCGNNL